MKIRLVTTPDWEWQALYINDRAVCQDHNISLRDLFDHLKDAEIIESDLNEDETEFPEKFGDL